MRLNSHSGFTLIEMIIVVVILSTVAAFSIYFLVDSVRLYAQMVNQKALLDEGRLALERICRDLRDAQSISLPVAGGSGSSLSFVRTHATDNAYGDGRNENITFRLRGNILEKVKSQPVAVRSLAENVSNFTVIRDAANAEIKLVLSLSRGSGERVTLQTRVYPRNLAADPIYKNFFTNWQER